MTRTAPCASGAGCSGSSQRRESPGPGRVGRPTEEDGLRLGLHERGRGPGDTGSLPYFTVDDMAAALERVYELGGSVVHPGERCDCLPRLGGKPVRAGCIAAGQGVIVGPERRGGHPFHRPARAAVACVGKR